MTRLMTGMLLKISDLTKTPGKGLKLKTQEKRFNYYIYVKNSVKIRTILPRQNMTRKSSNLKHFLYLLTSLEAKISPK